MKGIPVVEVYQNMFRDYGDQENPIEVVRHELMEYIRLSEDFHELLALYMLLNRDPIMYLGKDIDSVEEFAEYIRNSDEFKKARRNKGGSNAIRSQETT